MTGEKTEGVSGGVNSLVRSRSIIASYPTIDSRADGTNSHSGTPVFWLLVQLYYSLPIIISNTELKLEEYTRNTRTNRRSCFTCGNLFSKNNRTWEFIFEEKSLFEISENKNLSKITSYTV